MTETRQREHIQMTGLTLISSMAPLELLKELNACYQAKTSQSVSIEAAGGVEVAKRVRSGEAADAVVLARNVIDELAREGVLLASGIIDIAQAGIAVAVPGNTPPPDIADEEAVRRAVMAAASVSYSTGPSGLYLEKKFAAWGILDELRPRIVIPPPGVPVGSLVATGQVALGFQQLSELINVQGITLVGPLPPEMQQLTVFSGSVTRTSGNRARAGDLLQFMGSSEAAALMPRFGMEPCTMTTGCVP